MGSAGGSGNAVSGGTLPGGMASSGGEPDGRTLIAIVISTVDDPAPGVSAGATTFIVVMNVDVAVVSSA